MKTLLRWIKVRVFRRGENRTLKQALKQADVRDTGKPIEEETLFGYDRRNFYPVHIGMVFEGRYEVLGKLGYGGGSTVWFCRDKDLGRYVAVKVCAVHLSEDGTHDHRPHWEWEAYSRLLRMETENEGLHSVRRLTGRFMLQASTGARHPCFVYRLACLNILELKRFCDDGTLPVDLAQGTMRAVLRALDFLHTEARIIHTDIKEDNIFLLEDGDCSQLYAERLRKRRPTGRYDADGKRIVYRSIAFTDLLESEEMSESVGRPLLGDLGEAHILPDDVQELRPKVIAPLQFRSPETVLGLPWSFGVDIWSFGTLAFSLIFGSLLFNASDAGGNWSISIHLAQMTALMGPPPTEYLTQSPRGADFWGQEGQWLERDDVKIGDMEMDLEDRVEGSDPASTAQLVDFLRCIFKWKPEERATPAELLRHPFLNDADTEAESPAEPTDERDDEERR